MIVISFLFKWQIGLGETLCYRFVPSRKDDTISVDNEMYKYKRGPTIRVRKKRDYFYYFSNFIYNKVFNHLK